MWVADLADTRAVGDMARQAWDTLGGIDVLVNNAAIPKRRAVSALDPAEVEGVMRVNFFGPVQLTLALLPRMLARKAGMIVNVSSVGGRLGIIHEAAYCASKFALCGWSESMAVDLHGTGISVKLIEPGPVDTEIWDQPGNEEPLYQGPKAAADVVAGGSRRAWGARESGASRARSTPRSGTSRATRNPSTRGPRWPPTWWPRGSSRRWA